MEAIHQRLPIILLTYPQHNLQLLQPLSHEFEDLARLRNDVVAEGEEAHEVVMVQDEVGLNMRADLEGLQL